MFFARLPPRLIPISSSLVTAGGADQTNDDPARIFIWCPCHLKKKTNKKTNPTRRLFFQMNKTGKNF